MITYNTQIRSSIELSGAVTIAVKALQRDIKTTCTKSDLKGTDIALERDNSIAAEAFIIDAVSENTGEDILKISASDDFGFIYGIYHISKYFLGVNEFWFWNEQILPQNDGYKVPSDYHYESKPFKVRFRGWFINDEVLFDGWRQKVGDDFPWEMAFEALLRCGGNMTIPGTDQNAHKYKQLAADYGLWITHHHAEPLGARMFARAYPDLEASFDKYPDLFKGLWQEAIDEQKDMNIVWNIGFRGQGDRPFWADDPSYDTPKARGKLMSDLMLLQYDMLKKMNKDAICCMNLYGEIMELYKGGFLTIPDDVIKIWADNGFGKMVSRRQNNHNPRVFALPDKDDNSAHGIYYHVSFYDLQAAAMMTMLPNSPEFVIRQLSEVFERGVNDFWVINCSNVKPHTYYLSLIAEMWRGNIPALSHKDADFVYKADEFTRNYCSKYFGTGEVPSSVISEITQLYKLWPNYAVAYGPNEDDHAGEQFSNHGSRILACAFISNFDKKAPETTCKTSELDWLVNADNLKDQVKWHLDKYSEGVNNYKEYLDKACNLKSRLEKAENQKERELSRLLEDNLICQIKYHYYSYLGAYYICRSLMTCLSNDDNKDISINVLDYITAFYEAGMAKRAFEEGYDSMRSHEHGIWNGFYQNDCEADIRQSAFVAKSLMSYLRVLGDGPHFYKWQRHFQKDAGGDKVHLILRVKEHLSDDELLDLMDAQDQT